MKKIGNILVLVLLFVALITIPAGCGPGQEGEEGADPDSERTTFVIGGSSIGGLFYTLGSAMGEMIEAEIEGITTEVFAGNGGVNVSLVNQGEADIAFTLANSCILGQRGEAPYDEPHDNIKALMAVYPSHMHLVVHKDSDIKTLEDIRGKTVSGGMGMSNAGTQALRDLFAALEIGYDEATWDDLSFGDAASNFKDNHLDLWAPHMRAPYAGVEEVAINPGVRLLPLTEEIVAKMKEINPAHFVDVIKAGTYQGIDEDVLTAAVMTVVIVRADMEDEMVEKLLDIFLSDENLNKFYNTADAMRYLTLETAPLNTGIELHPAAERYFRERGVID